MVKEFSGNVGTSNGAGIRGWSKKHVFCVKLLIPNKRASAYRLSPLMRRSLKSCFARQIPQAVSFPESKRRGRRSLWTALSLSSLHCCSHHEFMHRAINVSPCGLGGTGCEPGRLIGWNLRAAQFCSSCTVTDERCKLFFFFLVNPVGIPSDPLSSCLSWVSPSSPSFDRGWSHTGGYGGGSNNTPNRRIDVVPSCRSSGSISHNWHWFSS